MDFKELDESVDGNRYALVFQDYLTKWPEVFAVKAQAAQKTRYDKAACGNIKVKEGDLVMLKVQPQFKLDHSFRGPYWVYTVTDTCAHIRPIDKPNDDLISFTPEIISMSQRRNKCSYSMDGSWKVKEAS